MTTKKAQGNGFSFRDFLVEQHDVEKRQKPLSTMERFDAWFHCLTVDEVCEYVEQYNYVKEPNQ